MSSHRRPYLNNDINRCPAPNTDLRKVFDAFKKAPMTPIIIKNIIPNMKNNANAYNIINNLTLFYNMEFVKTKNGGEWMLVSHCDEDYMKDKFCGIS
jgi:hypothetical protein